MNSPSNEHNAEEEAQKLAGVQPGSVIPYEDYIDKLRSEIARERESDQNSEKIIKVFKNEIEKEYFTGKIASIVIKAKKIYRHDKAISVGAELAKFILYTTLGFALGKLLPLIL